MAGAAHADHYVRELRQIRSRSWSRPETFQKLAQLYGHPVVSHRATRPDDPGARVVALKWMLKKTVSRMRVQEPRGRSAARRSPAAASEALLRLKPEYALDKLPVPELWAEVARRWPRLDGGGPVSVDTFRMHVADEKVYAPFAAELRRFAADYAREHGIALGESPEGWDFPLAPAELDGIGLRLWEMEARRSKKRCEAISKGAVQPRNQDEMLEMLAMLTESASTLEAVDHISIDQWSVEGSPVRDYLDLQLDRARRGDLTLERVRLVAEEELESRYAVQQLREFIALHENASASLLLCPVEEVRGTPFDSMVGMLLANRTTAPAAVKGWIGEGQIRNAMMYPPGSPSLDELVSGYQQLLSQVKGRLLDSKLRERLERAPAG